MVRSRWSPCVVAVLGACCLFLTGARAPRGVLTAQEGGAAPPQARPETPKAVLAIREKLARPARVEQGIPPNTPLADALDHLSQVHELPILIDHAAFRADGVAEPGQVPVSLPKMTSRALRTALHDLLARMDPPATFLHRYDHLVVLPRQRARPAGWTAEHRQLAPVVNVVLEGRPLDQALRELSYQTGINIVLDARAADHARTPVTATFAQAAVDAAVYVLADMADLKAVALDTVLYVTTRENAAALRTELEYSPLTAGTPPAGGQ